MDARLEPPLDKLLAAFGSGNELQAAKAFESLATLTRRGLDRYLRGRLHSSEAREDVVQEVLRRIWTRRGQFENRGASAWWSLVKLVAEQCRVDLVRKIGSEVVWDEAEMGEIQSQELPAMEALLETMDDRRLLYRIADELWLDFDPDLSDADRARRILAAHLFFSQGFSWEQVCDLLNRGNRLSPVTRGELDEWLTAPATILGLAFHSLYRDNDSLTCHLLNLDSDQLDSVCKTAFSGDESHPAPNGLTWAEIRAIVWRFRDADRHDRILAKDQCTLDKQELLELFDRCLTHFPFLEIMERLSSDLTKWPKAKLELAKAGLWQRLVFEYYAKDTTHHRDIYDRTAEPAATAPYSLTLGMLNVWLSNGRLFAKLAAYALERGEAQ